MACVKGGGGTEDRQDGTRVLLALSRPTTYGGSLYMREQMMTCANADIRISESYIYNTIKG